jgi:hypothetical protein
VRHISSDALEASLSHPHDFLHRRGRAVFVRHLHLKVWSSFSLFSE